MNNNLNVRSYVPADFEPGRAEACFVAKLLAIPPEEVFPKGPRFDEIGDTHLVEFVGSRLDDLYTDTDRVNDGSPEFQQYCRTLALCDGVMGGKIPVPPESMWNKIAEGCRSGYTPWGSPGV